MTTTKTKTLGIYEHSHWQGSGPDELLATGSRASLEAMVRALDTCSMCGSGRGRGGYSVGRCFLIREVGYARASVRRLPDEAADWSASDFAEWLAD